MLDETGAIPVRRLVFARSAGIRELGGLGLEHNTMGRYPNAIVCTAPVEGVSHFEASFLPSAHHHRVTFVDAQGQRMTFYVSTSAVLYWEPVEQPQGGV